jgi:hypothetical protein
VAVEVVICADLVEEGTTPVALAAVVPTLGEVPVPPGPGNLVAHRTFPFRHIR